VNSLAVAHQPAPGKWSSGSCTDCLTLLVLVYDKYFFYDHVYDICVNNTTCLAYTGKGGAYRPIVLQKKACDLLLKLKNNSSARRRKRTTLLFWWLAVLPFVSNEQPVCMV
jgi:hypothetical protein